MSEFIHKKHNVSVLMYHIVCAAKYRRMVFSETVDAKLKEVCREIQKRYEITFLEIGTDSDHVHFLVQSVPMYSPKAHGANDQKPAQRQRYSKPARKSRSSYGAASFGQTDTSSARLAHTPPKK